MTSSHVVVSEWVSEWLAGRQCHGRDGWRLGTAHRDQRDQAHVLACRPAADSWRLAGAMPDDACVSSAFRSRVRLSQEKVAALQPQLANAAAECARIFPETNAVIAELSGALARCVHGQRGRDAGGWGADFRATL